MYYPVPKCRYHLRPSTSFTHSATSSRPAPGANLCPGFQSASGALLCSSSPLLPNGLDADVQKGITVLPLNLPPSRNDSMMRGAMPYQMG